jgi:hypothetical protein
MTEASTSRFNMTGSLVSMRIRISFTYDARYAAHERSAAFMPLQRAIFRCSVFTPPSVNVLPRRRLTFREQSLLS